MIYAGVGSRKTPPLVLERMTEIARERGRAGWVLRSGAADKADQAFERGAVEVGGAVEIWLPWPRFNDHPSRLFPSVAAFALAATIMPWWDNMKRSHKSLHARNCHQILGADLNTPVDEVVCWTPNGKAVGGTRTAIVLAEARGVAVRNLWNEMKL